MIARLSPLWFILMLSTGLPAKVSEIDAAAFARLNVEDARLELAALGASASGVTAHRFSEAVLKAERMDLIELCYETRVVAPYLALGIRETPAGPFKNKLLLMILRNANKSWPPPEPAVRVYEGPTTELERIGLTNSVIGMVRAYLPDTPLDYNLISTPEARHKLAAEYEAAVAPVEGGPGRGPASRWPLSAGPGDSPVGAQRKPAAAPDEEPVGGAFAGLWAGGALLLLAVAVWYYQCRSGRRPSRQP